MDKILGTLTIGIIFRHFLSGGIFVAALLYTQDRCIGHICKILEHHIALWSTLALFIGTIIYSLHRGFTNPIFEFIRHYCIPGFMRPLFMPARVRTMLLKRWEFAWTEGKKAFKSQHVYAWGDYVHLLYTSGLAVWLGSISAALFIKPGLHQKWVWDSPTFFIGLVLVGVGFITDFRKHIVEESLYE